MELIDHLEPFLDAAIQALTRRAAGFDGHRPDLVLYGFTSRPARVLTHRWGCMAAEGGAPGAADPIEEDSRAHPRG